MSTLTYEQQYQQILSDLNEVQQEDAAAGVQRLAGSAKDRNKYFTDYYLAIYVKYLTLARRLTVIYDSQLQPQKLSEVRVLLDSCIGRMLETKAALVANAGDFIMLDNLMLDLKLSPDEMEPPIPSYILEDRREEIQRQRNYIASLQEHYAETDPESLVSLARGLSTFKRDPTKVPTVDGKAEGGASSAAAGTEPTKQMTISEAVKILQICERGRQARQRAKFQISIYRQQQYALSQGKEFQTLSGKDKAATIVQKVAKGFLERQKAEERYQFEKKFLGMSPSEALLQSKEKEMAEMRMKERKSRQKANIADLEKKRVEMEANLRAKEGPKSIENMLDEVLMHMAYARLEKKDGAVVELPPPEEGGSLALLGRNKDSSAKRKSSVRQGSLAKGGSTQRSASQATAGGKKDKDDDTLDPLPPSKHWDTMKTGAERYDDIWREKFKSSYVDDKDLNQAMDEEMLQKQLLEGPMGVMSELRTCVDQIVMMEVDNLKERIAAEKKSKKKAKKAKKPKKPKLKDPRKGVDIETSLNTCVFENVLQLPPANVTLENFIGSANVAANPLDSALRTQTPDDEIKKKWQKIIRNWNDDTTTSLKMSKETFEKLFDQYLKQNTILRDPSAFESRTFVAENGILPLGSQVIHDLAPNVNSVLFYGFPSTGKTTMAFALANACGALFFNLSPAVFASVKSIPKLIQMVFYVAQVKGPSVIYIENIEKVFSKGGKKKKDKLAARAKKMKKELIKAMNGLQPTDRVLVIGVSSEPWMGDSAVLAQRFPRALYFPLPDYPTRTEMLSSFISKKIPSTDASVLAPETVETVSLLTDGYSAGMLKRLVDVTLHPHRVQRLLQQPLEAQDFVRGLASIQKFSKAEKEQMTSFYSSLPFTNRRANAVEDFKESEEELKKKKKKPAKKKAAE